MRQTILAIAVLAVSVAHAALTQDDFTRMRQAMRQEIVLGVDNDYTDNPIVAAYISDCARIGDSLWHTMRHDTTFLWDNLTKLTDVPAYTPYHIHLSYINLHRMTRAWAYTSSPLYHNDSLLADIRYGLDFLAHNAYNNDLPHIGNWWEWQIGIPFDYCNMVCMLYDVLTQEEIATFDNTAGHIVYKTAVYGNLTYANQASICRNLLFVGLLTSNETYIREACENAVRALVDTTSIATRNAAQAMYEDILRAQSQYQHNTVVWAKEGLYPDGTFIQHIAIPYIGHYGCEMMEMVADMVLLFKGTPIMIPQPIQDVLPLWITRTYLPAIYRGGFMTMFMGRTGFKRNPYYYGRNCILNIFRISPILSDSVREDVQQACRAMHLELANINSPYEKMDAMPVIAHTIDQINASNVSTEQDKPFSIVYAAGDRVVHQMKRARFGLAMSSNRIGKYEAFVRSMDSENATGWYTGDGMTFLYTPDAPAHYASYLLTANPYLVPGTTVDRSLRQAIPSDMILFSHSSLAPDIARAGGACLNGLYSVAAMQLLGSDAELYAKKSWFMFDEEIVCLGSDIHQNRNEEVITVVENRITDAPWVTAKHYAWLDKVAGYYFPENDRFETAVSENDCREMTISHGVAPQNAHYAYVLLPGFTKRETIHYNHSPKTRIIAHSNVVHAVAKPDLHLTAFVFFAEGKAAGLHSDGPACVLMQKNGDSITLAVSDPTWQRKTITLNLNGYPPIVIHTENSMGQTHTLTIKNDNMNLFSLEGKNAWITGASYGIGFNIAKAFVAAGVKNIIFNDINEEALKRGLDNYATAGITNVHGYVCNVTDENAVKALVEKIHAEVGQIDILVNNAGIIKRIPMHEMKRSEFQAVIDVDLVAPYIVSAAVLPEMMERREGKIINICSMMSELGRETVSAYAAAKGGLKMLTRNICSEYGAYNIQCNGIGPGYIATPQTAPLRERQPDGSHHPFDSFICAKTPAGRWLEPEELGGPAVFLASHASDAVNGHVLYVDGGILAYIGKQPE